MAKEKHAATFLGTSSSLVYVGERCYSYGGAIGVVNSVTTILGPFTTGKFTIVGELQITDSSATNDDIKYNILINGTAVQTYISKNAGDSLGYPTILVIPPLSTVEVTGYNLTGSGNRIQTAMFTGRIVDA